MEDEKEYVKIGLPASDGKGYERVWASVVEGEPEGVFRIENDPVTNNEVNFRDLVRTKKGGDGRLTYAGMHRRSGLRTVLVTLKEERDDKEVITFGKELRGRGFSGERLTWTHMSFSVPEERLDEIVQELQAKGFVQDATVKPLEDGSPVPAEHEA